MDDLLGIGGESIVIKFQSQSGLIAIKIIPLHDSDPKTKTSVEKDQNVFKSSKISKVSNFSRPKKNLTNKVRAAFKLNQKLEKFEKVEEIEIDSTEGLKEIIQSEKESENVLKNEAEFECASIQHPNIIGYQNVTLDIVDDYAALLAGKIIKPCPKIKLENIYL